MIRIALDIDNVVCDIVASARAEIARERGLAVDDVLLTGIYHRPFAIARGDGLFTIAIEHAFWDRDAVLVDAPACAGAREAVLRAADAGILAGYATRRPKAVERVTRAWLGALGLPTEPVLHVGTQNARTTNAICKSEACAALGATHLVDDHADEIDRARRAGVEVVVVDADIGRDARAAVLRTHPDVMVARDLAHAVDMLISLRDARS